MYTFANESLTADLSPSRVVRLGRQFEMTRMVFTIYEDRTESACMIDHNRQVGFLQSSASQTLEVICRGMGDISKCRIGLVYSSVLSRVSTVQIKHE